MAVIDNATNKETDKATVSQRPNWRGDEQIVIEILDIRGGTCRGKCIKIKENRNGGLGPRVLIVFSIFRGSSCTTIKFGQIMREPSEDISGGMAETEDLAAAESTWVVLWI